MHVLVVDPPPDDSDAREAHENQFERLPDNIAAVERRIAICVSAKEFDRRSDSQTGRKYRKELLREGVECLLAGDVDTGKAILRDYINATIGFEELSRLTRRPAKSLMRMLGPKGNPQARNLFEVIGHLQRVEGLHFELSLKAAS